MSSDPSPQQENDPRAPKALKEVEVSYEHSRNLPQLLESLGLSVVISTYQAGRVVTLGSQQGQLQVAFSHFDQAMGLCRTPSGIVVGSRDAIWTMPANREIAGHLEPVGTHDIAFLARQAHWSGPVMGHDLAWCGGKLWLVNTLFNGLCTIEMPWSFVPQWRPPFISAWEAGDRCHLNGLAIKEDASGPAFVTALGETDTVAGWRENKANGGCLIDVASGTTVLKGLSMPHSPRIYKDQLYLLNSGYGDLMRVRPDLQQLETVTRVPGFTRGLDCFGGYAFVGMSQIRETAVFGGLPIQEKDTELKCGLAVVNLATSAVEAMFWFHSGVEEVFAVTVLPGWKNPVLIGPDRDLDSSQTVWLVPEHARP
jgi:uncharacterized protein (TIGR03032 family)